MQPDMFDGLPAETLKSLAHMYAQNWQTLDSQWFRNVEAEFGLEAAVRVDLKNWETQSVVEAGRIKKVLGITAGGLPAVLRVVSFMSWQVVSPGFVIETNTPERIVFRYPHCSVQEGRSRQGKPEFPCRTMKQLLLSSVAGMVEPRAKLRCLVCPPDPHPSEYWCRWELTLDNPANI